MAAELDNKHAEKWTKEATLELMERAREAIGPNRYFLSEVAEAIDEYPDLFRYLARKFSEDVEVFRAIKRLYTKCEATITRKTADGAIVPSLGIFILKAYHDLIEVNKVQQEQYGKDGGAIQTEAKHIVEFRDYSNGENSSTVQQ